MSEWISVEDRLPKENGDYIIYLNDGNPVFDKDIFYKDLVVINIINTAKYDCGKWFYYDDDEWDITDIVTHWMPLPEPPRMEGE